MKRKDNMLLATRKQMQVMQEKHTIMTLALSRYLPAEPGAVYPTYTNSTKLYSQTK